MHELRHVVSAGQFDREFLDRIMARTARFDSGSFRWDLGNKPRIMATLFYESSTRTRLSFETAMLRMGGQVISTENAKEFSSASKGETLEDTIRVVSGYADLIVLRHDEDGAAARAAAVSRMPIINAGDGKREHPSQALLDLYTVWKELGPKRLDDGVSVAFIGDIRYSRTVHSLWHLLAKYSFRRAVLCATRTTQATSDQQRFLRGICPDVTVTEDINAAVVGADIVYVTRIQKERFKRFPKEYKRAKGKLIVTPEVMGHMLPGAILMHPLPRVDELTPACDADPRSAYFRTTDYGVPLRQALIEWVLNLKE